MQTNINTNIITETIKEKQISNDTIVYQSSPNGVADIQLSILPDGKFTYYMKILPEPMSDEKEDIIETQGKWLTKGDWTQLIFSDDKIEVDTLFDRTYSDEEQFEITNSNTIAIHNSFVDIDIWGVSCTREVITQKF